MIGLAKLAKVLKTVAPFTGEKKELVLLVATILEMLDAAE